MSQRIHHFLMMNVKLWQAVLFSIILTITTIGATAFVMNRAEQYQYSNITTQKQLVDSRVAPVESDMRKLIDRQDAVEGTVNLKLKELDSTNRKLENLMFDASPSVMMQMARDKAQVERNKLEKPERTNNVSQIASPTININTGGKID